MEVREIRCISRTQKNLYQNVLLTMMKIVLPIVLLVQDLEIVLVRIIIVRYKVILSFSQIIFQTHIITVRNVVECRDNKCGCKY